MIRPPHVRSGPYAPPDPRRTLTVTSADGSRLHAEVHGPEDAPALVLAHGWTCNTAFWAPVVRRLADDFRVITYDQRGHGRSPAVPAGGYSTTALADDLGAVLDATLRPGEKALLAGHSMGAMTILAAADRPYLRERAAAAVLCSTGASRLRAESRVIPVGPKSLRRFLHRALLVSKAPLGPVTPLAKRLIKYGTMGPDATPAQVEACARIVHGCDRVVRGHWGRVLAGLDLSGEVRRVPVPTAIVQGASDRLTPAVHARRIAAALPHCTGLTELPRRGHMTPVEDAETVAGLIRTMAREHLVTAGAEQEDAPREPVREESA